MIVKALLCYVLIIAISSTIGSSNSSQEGRFRINRGYIDKYGRFPFIVPIWPEGLNEYGSISGVFCGGSIISDEFVLTAAHCLSGDYDYIRIYFGSNDTEAKSESERIEMKVPPENVISYTTYDFDRKEHDIALIKLPQKLDFNYRIQPIRLPKRSQVTLDHIPCIIAGWGAVGSKAIHSSFIRYGRVTILPDNECKKVYHRYYHSSNLCIDGTYHGACSGDSGGPAFIEEEPDRRFTQVGIAAYTHGCEKYHTAYTRITPYLDWIHQHTRIPIRD